MMMKQFMKLGALGALLALAGCSSSDDAMPDTASGMGTAQTVLESGVKEIPVVVTRGTTAVTVKYKSAGKDAELSVPFTQTASHTNSALVSGHIRLYSATPTSVDLYDGTTRIGQDVLLPGRVLGTAATTGTATATQNAYYLVCIDERIAGGQPFNGQDLTHFYPKDEKGDPGYGGSYGNTGQVQTDGVDWYTTNDGRKYVYSRDGSATAGLLKSIPESAILKSLPVPQIQQDFASKYKIIWYMVQQRTSNGTPRVFGYLTLKDTPKVPNDPLYTDRSLPAPVDPDQPSTAEGTYHDAGVMLYDGDGDKDYNDLVVDYDVEARFPKDGQSPYVKVVMHLRALSDKGLDEVGLNLSGLDLYVCPVDDMHVTIHGIDVKDTPLDGVPDFRDCGLTLRQGDALTLTGGNLQWLLTNGNEHGWFGLDSQGWYNVTQSAFNGKPFATLSFMLYPREAESGEDIEQAVADIMSAAGKGFLFNGKAGNYIIAPVGTPHPAEGSTLAEAFPAYPDGTWWTTFDGDRVVSIGQDYTGL